MLKHGSPLRSLVYDSMFFTWWTSGRRTSLFYVTSHPIDAGLTLSPSRQLPGWHGQGQALESLCISDVWVYTTDIFIHLLLIFITPVCSYIPERLQVSSGGVCGIATEAPWLCCYAATSLGTSLNPAERSDYNSLNLGWKWSNEKTSERQISSVLSGVCVCVFTAWAANCLFVCHLMCGLNVK